MQRAMIGLLGLLVLTGPATAEEKKEQKKPQLPPNPEATKLLAEARAARAVWNNFPGFSAALVINVDGVVHKGTVEVGEDGKVKVNLADKEVTKWALGHLRSVASHRMISAP